MSSGVRDPEVLRQRLIAALKQRNQDKGLQLARTQSAADVEDGEIIESSSLAGSMPERPALAQLPAVTPDPHEARNMVRFLHSKGLQYHDFLAQGLSADFIKQAYADLGLTDNASTKHSRTRKPVRRGKAPSIKRKMPLAESNTTRRILEQDQQSPNSSTPTPPWMHMDVTAEKINGLKRPAPTIASTMIQQRQKRCLGLRQHPSLVIELNDSDASDDEQRGTAQSNKVLHVVQAQSLDRLQQMEVDIAATMTLINKAQDLQNARKTRPTGGPIPASHPTVSEQDGSDRYGSEQGDKSPSNDSRRAQTGQLNDLQLELIENENTTTARTKDLSELESEEAQIRRLAEDNQRRQDKDIEVIESIESSIAKLQEQLLTAKQSLAETVLTNQKLQRQAKTIETSRVSMQEQVANLQIRRAILRPEILAIQQAIVQPVATNPRRKPEQHTGSPNHAPKITSQTIYTHDINAIGDQSRNELKPANVEEPSVPNLMSLDNTPGTGKGSADKGSMRSTTTQTMMSSTKGINVTTPSSSSRSASTIESAADDSDVQPLKQSTHSRSSYSEGASASVSSSTSETASKDNRRPQLYADIMDGVPSTQVYIDDTSLSSEANGASLKIYEHNSPLDRFKAFKLHKLYPRVVESGYRSNRYFTKLNADAMLCKFETQGGICSQSSQCPDTHFNAVNMTDDEILIELSNYSVGSTKRERMQYRDGLRTLVQQLKSDNIADFDSVSLKIVDFRRTCLKDDSQSVSSLLV